MSNLETVTVMEQLLILKALLKIKSLEVKIMLNTEIKKRRIQKTRMYQLMMLIKKKKRIYKTKIFLTLKRKLPRLTKKFRPKEKNRKNLRIKKRKKRMQRTRKNWNKIAKMRILTLV